MFSSISPYTLLCASKPKPAPIPSAYDLYSITHHNESLDAVMPRPITSDPQPCLPASMNPPPRQERKTHYISDIHIRHSAAFSKASLQAANMPAL